MAGGLDWGGGGGTTTDSDLDAPALAFLGEITAPKMKSARAVAVGPDTAIFVADPVGQAVHKFTANGTPAGRIAVPLPLGVAVDGAGRVYASDAATGSVRIFDENGGLLGYLGTGMREFAYPMGLAWDPTDDTILVADRDANEVKVFSTSGAMISSFGSPGTAAGQFSRPLDVLVDDAGGRYFVVDAGSYRIQVFDRAGAYLDHFGSPGSGKTEMTSPAGIGLDGAGRLYVTDTYQSTLQVLDTEGLHVSYIGEFGDHYGQINLTTDAVMDSFNRLLVASYLTKKVVVYGIDDFAQPPPDRKPLIAQVLLAPPTLNGRSRSDYLHAQITLPTADVRDIEVDSVRLHGLARDTSAPVTYDDVNGDGSEELILRFSRLALLDAIPGPGTHALSLTGDLSTGDTLVGEAVAHVLEEVP